MDELKRVSDEERASINKTHKRRRPCGSLEKAEQQFKAKRLPRNIAMYVSSYDWQPAGNARCAVASDLAAQIRHNQPRRALQL